MGYYEGIAARRFIKDDGAYYVLPYGNLGRRRQFDDEADYEEARSYFIRTYQWLLPVGAASGIAIAKFGMIASPAALALLVFYYAVVLPRISRNTVKV